MMRRYLALLAVGFIAFGHTRVARSQTLTFEDCRFSAEEPPKVGLGQRLADADWLDALAKEFEDFPYETCFRLGRSCTEISPKIQGDVANDVHARCRFYYPAPVAMKFEDWLPKRTAYNVCMAKFLRREAGKIRGDVLGQGKDSATVSEVLNALSGSGPWELDANAVEALSTNVTWCPTNGADFAAAILCRGGGMVVGTPQGEERLEFRVSEDGSICLWDFAAPEICHKVIFSEGGLVLSPRHRLIGGAFTVFPGVERGQWRQTCRGR